jgi:hypothetical protein
MGTDIRAEVSTKNRYWIDKHRYYELKHFCLQYPQWKKMYAFLDGLPNHSSTTVSFEKSGSVSSPTEVYAEARIYFYDRMKMVEDAAKKLLNLWEDCCLEPLRGASYECLNAQVRIPCCKDTWYAIYRRFFWLLDKARK